MSNSLFDNEIDYLTSDLSTLLRGSARVLWWNTQENVREGGSWIGIEKHVPKAAPTSRSIPPFMSTRGSSAFGHFLVHTNGKLADLMTRHAPRDQHAR